MAFFNDAGEAFNQVTDTIGDAAEKGISDAGEAFNQVTTTTFGDAAPEDGDTSSQDNNLWNPVNSMSPGGLNSPERRAERRAEIRAERRDTPGDVLSDPPAAEYAPTAANKYKGIIQLVVLAVVIAGTVGAYLWGKN